MTIHITEDRIRIINALINLSVVHKSQLSFWNFQYDQTDSSYYGELNEELFNKLTAYFKKEKIQFEYTEAAETYSKTLETSVADFQSLKEKANGYKHGKFDKLEYSDFRNFVVTNIKRNLKSHQLKASYHLYTLGNGANFSVPGSGKTTVVLTVYEKLRQEGLVNILIVIGPPSCFGPWKNEFLETLGRDSKAEVLAGGKKGDRKKYYQSSYNKKTELLLTSFQSFLSDQKEAAAFLKNKSINAFLVIDEAHYIKQINGNWANAVLNLAQAAKYRCVLTGTPMPKSYTDIFNLFDFLWPKIHPIPSNNKSVIKASELRGNRQSVKTILNSDIGSLFYRVRKSDLNLLSQNFITPYVIEMGEYERLVYDAIYDRIKNYSKSNYFKNIDFIKRIGKGRMIRLRQAISYVKMISSTIDDYNEELLEDEINLKGIINNYDKLEVPAKIDFLVEKVKELQSNKQKVVIWSNFIQTIRLIENVIMNNGMKCKVIFGDTPVEGTTVKSEETREKIRDEFVDENSGLDILVANPAACAESISLHKTCHHAIYYDLSYNCAQYLQSLDRIHRVGGSETQEAYYYFLQYSNTIDVDIQLSLESKRAKMYDIFEQEYPIYSLNMFEDDEEVEAYKRLFIKKAKTK